MDNLVAWLSRIDDCALDTVVHVGAGAGAVLEQYAALPAARQPRTVVLIEGDPDRARDLERAAAPYPWARVRPTPVDAQGGPMPWNRFNLPMLNGPLDATALTAVYPRLRRVRATTVQCEALVDVLGALALQPAKEEQRAHVLMLDVPGQEAALLETLPPELLRQFHAVLLRGCRSVLPPSGQVAQAALALLARQHFTPVAQDGERDTLWPAALLRFDPVGYELAQLRRQLVQRDATLVERDRVVGELQSAVQAKASADKLAAERLAKTLEQDERIKQLAAQLTATRDERDRILGASQTATQAKASADKLAAERLAKTLEQDERIGQLEAQLAEANLRLELLQQEVMKAEGQLALLKELLLEEPSL